MQTVVPYIDNNYIKQEYMKKLHYGLPEQFHDLSPRRQRQLQQFIDAKLQECEETVNAYIDQKTKEFLDLAQTLDKEYEEGRKDAGLNAVVIGIKTLNEIYGFGLHRIARLVYAWQKDLKDFYEDRDVREPQLKKWIEDIGFTFDNGQLIGYKDTNDNLIHKRVADKLELEENN